MNRSRSSSRPSTILLAAVLLAVEAVAALTFTGVEVTQIRLTRAVVGVGTAVLLGAYGVLLVLVSRGVFRGRRWSRGPAVVTQLILLPIAWSFRDSPTTLVAVVMAAVSVATLVGLLHPRSTRIFLDPTASDPAEEPGGDP
jgi:hypothetical protein